MRPADAVERAVHAALEKRKEPLHGVRRYVAARILAPAVIHHVVARVLLANGPIRGALIRHDSRRPIYVGENGALKLLRGHAIWRNRAHPTTTLDHCDYRRLAI